MNNHEKWSDIGIGTCTFREVILIEVDKRVCTAYRPHLYVKMIELILYKFPVI